MSMDAYSMIGYYDYNMLNVERVPQQNIKRGLETDNIFNQTETDIDFMDSLYRNSNPQYFLGSWIVKPVVEILLHYMGIPNVSSKDKNLEDVLDNFYSAKRSQILQLFRELGLYGQIYAVVSYDKTLNLPNIRVKNSDSIVERRYENYADPTDLTYVRVREHLYSYKDNSNDDDDIDGNVTESDVTVDKIYWKERKKGIAEGNEQSDDDFNYYYKIYKRTDNQDWTKVKGKTENPYGVIPVVEFNQNMLSSDKSGYSDANGLVKLAGVYHQIFESAIDANIYNGKPTLVFTGLTNVTKFIKSTYGDIDAESGDTLDYGNYQLFGAYYLEGDANAKYLEIPMQSVEYAKSLLELLFYIFVQVSGVPEWALGAHIDGTWASTKMQSTPLVQKIESKRDDVNDKIVKLNIVLGKVYEANNSDANFSTYATSVDWNEPLPEDRDYILSAINAIIPLDILSSETILTLLDLVADPKSEIKKHQKEKNKQALTDDQKQALITQVQGKVKGKLNNQTNNAQAGEMDAYEKVLTSLFGDNYAEVLGLDEE